MSTEAQVHDAANALVERGDRPTLAAVRRELGGGSYTTISEAMKRWREQQSEQREAAAAPAMPERVQEQGEVLLRAVWQAATGEAQQNIAAREEAAEQREREAEAQVIEFRDALKDVEQERDQLNERIESLLRERDEARRDNTALDQRTREIEQQLAVVQERASAAEQRNADAHRRADAAEQRATSAEQRLDAVIERLGTPGDSA